MKMNKDDYDIILDSVKGKAKGVLMANKNEEQNIPQMVGLSKVQLFLFLIAGMLVGALAFSLGYLFHKNERHFSLESAYNFPEEKYKIGNPSTNTAHKKNEYPHNKAINEEKDALNLNYYILIGKYKTIEDSQKVQNKLQIKSGKLATLKQTNDGVLLFIGPFESESLAKNERNLLSQKSYILGSITNVV